MANQDDVKKNHLFGDSSDDLFKEYCIGDLTNYKTNQIALRWRTKHEVISGKGEFICGNKKCDSKEMLTSWEVNFKYIENGKKNNALVKLKLCEMCSLKLNYRKKRKKWHEKENKVISTDQEKCDKIDEPQNRSNDPNDLWKVKNLYNFNLDISTKIISYLEDIL